MSKANAWRLGPASSRGWLDGVGVLWCGVLVACGPGTETGQVGLESQETVRDSASSAESHASEEPGSQREGPPTLSEPAPSITAALTVVDAQGHESSATDGSLLATWWPEGSGSPLTLSVERGAVRFTPPNGATAVTLSHVALDGAAAWTTEFEWPLNRSSLEWRFQRPQPIEFDVHDVGGRRLAGVRVIAGDGRGDQGRHPGLVPAERVRAQGDAPLTWSAAPSDPVVWQETVWVGAADHAWQRVEIDRWAGEAVHVTLEHAATLELTASPERRGTLSIELTDAAEIPPVERMASSERESELLDALDAFRASQISEPWLSLAVTEWPVTVTGLPLTPLRLVWRSDAGQVEEAHVDLSGETRVAMSLPFEAP